MHHTTHSHSPNGQAGHEDFIHRLAELSLDDLDRVAASIEDSMMSSAAWIEWRKAVAAADRAVRRLGRARDAGAAAHQAAAAVITALDDQLNLPDARVTLVARAARETAAALVAEDGDPEAAAHLLAPWLPLMAAPTAA